MPGFKEMRLPVEVSAWMVGGPMWSTRVFGTENASESRLSLWDYPLHKWDISNGLRELSNAAATKRFQIRARGRAYAFRVLDPLDYEVTYTEGRLIETDTPDVYQLVKDYTEDGDTFRRKILKPIPNTVFLKDAGTDFEPDLIDYKTGLVTIEDGDPDELSWKGLFDVPVRFVEDWLQAGVDSGGLLNWNGANIIEVRTIGESTGTPPELFDPVYLTPTPTTPPGPSPGPPPPPPGGGGGVTTLSSGDAVPIIGSAGDQFRYKVTIPPGASLVSLYTQGSFGAFGVDVNLYVKIGAIASPTVFDYASAEAEWSNEYVDVNTPAAGEWYATVVLATNVSAESGTTMNAFFF